MRVLPSPPGPRLHRAIRLLRASAIGLSLLVAGTSSLQNAVANGDTRTLTLHHTHRNDTATFTFKKDGRYDPGVLEKLNWFLRDWRNDKATKMDPHLFDIVWEVYRETDASAPIQIVSAYRSPETNAMLRSRSRGVAKFSQHMLGKAMDFYIPGVKLVDLRVAGLRLQRGGVGFYPTSGSPFVHMDTGNVRHWPRMTRSQLVQVFPDGKTVHVPTDGKPLAHYAEALAEIRARGSDSGVAMASADGGKGIKTFFAGLFGKKGEDDQESSEESAGAPAPQTRAVAEAAPAEVAPQPAPLPTARPAEVATGVLVAQQFASVAPLPLRRPPEAPGGRTPRDRTQLAAAPLPAVITRGTAREGDRPAEVLGYAAAGDVFGPPPVRARVSAERRPQERARNPHAIAFGRLFLSPSLSSELYLQEPELRVFATFMSPPQQVVATAFSRSKATGTTRSGFSGTAVADLPTFVFRSPAVALTQRM